VLLGIGRIKRVVSRREDWVTCHVLTPVVKGYAPRVGACMRTECAQAVQFRLPGEPSAVLLTDWAVWSLDLGMMKDGFAKDEVTVRRQAKS